MCAQPCPSNFTDRWVSSNLFQCTLHHRIGRTRRFSTIALFAASAAFVCIGVNFTNIEVVSNLNKHVAKVQAFRDADFMNTTIATSAFSPIPRVLAPAVRQLLPMLSPETQVRPETFSLPYTKPVEPDFFYQSTASAGSLSPLSQLGMHHAWFPVHRSIPAISPDLQPEAAQSNAHRSGERAASTRARATTALKPANRGTPVVKAKEVTFRRIVRPAIPGDSEQIRRLVFASLMANDAFAKDPEKVNRFFAREALPDARKGSPGSEDHYLVVEEIEDSANSPNGRLVGSLRLETPIVSKSAESDASHRVSANSPGCEVRLGMIAVVPELGYKGVGLMLMKEAETQLEEQASETLASAQPSRLTPRATACRIIAPAINIPQDLATLAERGYKPLHGEQMQQAFPTFYKDVAMEKLLKHRDATMQKRPLAKAFANIPAALELTEVVSQTSGGANTRIIYSAILVCFVAFSCTFFGMLSSQFGAKGAGMEPLLARNTLSIV